jgi:hypothetical protein
MLLEAEQGSKGRGIIETLRLLRAFLYQVLALGGAYVPQTIDSF